MLYTEKFPIIFKPIASSGAEIQVGKARFSLLGSRLIRMEYHPGGNFEDRPSQVVWYREQTVPDFKTRTIADILEIETADLILRYANHNNGFTPENLSVELKSEGVRWNYGKDDSANLLGTYRTLDMAQGALELESGLLSRSGWSLLDDSHSLVFNQQGWLETRFKDSLDLYFFGYGYNYAACLRDYFRIAGNVPIIPRWVLGNWWSRYWAYTADELLELMDQFKDKQVPLSVCIVDMDWHITATGNESSGWTGYTWNKILFPDPPGFIENLHKRRLKTALNLHPAEGIYPHEEQYPAMADRLGIDPSSKEPVEFDITDPDFTAAYFELLHHPLEEAGVDFWWLDWQQGSTSRISRLDPLWWLNHLHYYDLGRNQDKRSFIFSRWGGMGNHRYPIGFSGDTIVSWDSLAYQPYFTATAANVGYGWWSHDIGGHMGGIEDPELFTRWVQYGLFSPILRLHSTKTRYHERLPWAHDPHTEELTRRAMQLRHAFIPYLYTMAWRYQENGIAPIRPMYHDLPTDERAYNCQNQYYFGSELLAAPYTAAREPETRLSRQVVWLPEGDWYHFFNGNHYPGDCWYALHGALDDIPVFAKAGAIIPLARYSSWGTPANPEELEIHIYPGDDNKFELYEDNGLESYSLTTLTSKWSEKGWHFEIAPVTGDTSHLPIMRTFQIHIHNLLPESEILLRLNDENLECVKTYQPGNKTITLSDIPLSARDRMNIEIQPVLNRTQSLWDVITRMIYAFRMDTWDKEHLTRQLKEIIEYPLELSRYGGSLSDKQYRALFETISGSGSHLFKDYRTNQQKLILWNNHEHRGLQLRWSCRHFHDASTGSLTIPKFGLITFAEDWFSIHQSTSLPNDPIPMNERIPASQWRVDLHYGLRTITHKKLSSQT
jgi:alpha-glucosidase (family GH31 glycosyl hydrolase)